ncbi:unnamed protein product [Acanthoscelides obtectus]|uniref:Uncharacterized protein n=1 Tax=Acanthoscelides obtectus TaxID=200917 RepID=A0A9P0KPE4_ACAOB|nr:unnamed protein product [Acanthoscelides obtectus]CAK1653750.1 hypothetical protein AOBTE_LOCUS18350 [Acanthoscelides obtectus]
MNGTFIHVPSRLIYQAENEK